MRWKIGLCLALTTAAFYLMTMPTQFVCRDAVDEVAWATAAHPHVRSNHLLTTPLYAGVLHLSRWSGAEIPPFLALELTDIAFGIGCAVLLYATLIVLEVGEKVAGFLALAAAVSPGMQEHAASVETGVQPQLFFMLSLFFLAKYLRAGPRKRAYASIALVMASVSVLFALNMVVALPAFLFVLWYDGRRTREVSLGWLTAVSCAVCVAVLVVPMLLGAWAEGVGSVRGFLDWVFVHPESARLAHMRASFDFERLLRPVAGLVRVFWPVGPGMTLVKIMVRGSAGFRDVDPSEYLALIFGLLVVVSVGGLAVKGTLTKLRSPITLFCWIGLAGFYAFNAYWTGGDSQFWLPGLPLLLVLAGGALRVVGARLWPQRILHGFVLLPLVTMMGLSLFCGTELPSLCSPLGGKIVQDTRRFSTELNAGDLVLTPGRSWVEMIGKLRHDVRVIDLVYDPDLRAPDMFRVQVGALIDRALDSGHSVRVDGLIGPMFVEQLGVWEMMRSGQGLSRDQLRQHLAERYVLKPDPHFPDGRIWSVERRSG